MTRAAHMGPWSVATSGTWLVALTAPPPVWLRLSAHEDAAMAVVQAALGEDSVYLCTLGVEPALAGKGHGSRLLQRSFAEMGKKWRRCVLRTEQPKNVPFYRRNGFRQIDERVVLQSGLRVWVFSRPLSEGGRPTASSAPSRGLPCATASGTGLLEAEELD